MCGESSKQIQRYIRLTELQPKLLDMVDNRRLNFTVAVDISYIDKESKVDIRNPPSLLAHERSRFATCQWELLTPTDISIPLTHRLVLYALEAGECLFCVHMHQYTTSHSVNPCAGIVGPASARIFDSMISATCSGG